MTALMTDDLEMQKSILMGWIVLINSLSVEPFNGLIKPSINTPKAGLAIQIEIWSM